MRIVIQLKTMIKPKHVGKRLLIRKGWSSRPDEVKIIEVSPDEKYFKCRYITSPTKYTTWESVNGWIVESELPDILEVV